MAEKTYIKVEQRVTRAIPDWKEWPRRLRRIYASLEDIGSSDAAIQDAVEQWGWNWAQIEKLAKATPTYLQEIQAYRYDGKYPKKRDGSKTSGLPNSKRSTCEKANSPASPHWTKTLKQPASTPQ